MPALDRGLGAPHVGLAGEDHEEQHALEHIHRRVGQSVPALQHTSARLRTAQRQQVVAFKSYLRTVIHELCHHLDYELLKLPETFHTDGFYKRESSLAGALLAQVQTLDCQSPDISPDRSVRPSSGNHR